MGARASAKRNRRVYREENFRVKRYFARYCDSSGKIAEAISLAFLYAVILSVLLLPNKALATVFFSTITSKYIIIAIDSRETFTRQSSTNVCKVALLPNNMVYFGDGIVNSSLDDIKFNVRDLAKDVVNEYKSNDVEKIRDLFTQKAAKIYERLFYLHEAEASSAAPQGMLQHGFFAGLNSAGNPIIAADEIIYDRARTPKVVTKSTTFQMDGDGVRNLVVAHKEIVAEFGADISKRAQELLNSFGYVSGDSSVENYAIRAKAIVTAIRDWSGDNKIGGDIAVITIESGQKWNWFNRPAFCPQLR
jgi:hypothetical protein